MATMRIPEVEKTEMKKICNYSSYEIPVVLFYSEDETRFRVTKL